MNKLCWLFVSVAMFYLFIYLIIYFFYAEVQAQGGTKRLIAPGQSPSDGRLGNM